MMALWNAVRAQILLSAMSRSESADPVEGRRQAQFRRPPMVDRFSLEILGLVLGGVTAVVIAIAVLVVRSHVTTNVVLERAPSVQPVAMSQH